MAYCSYFIASCRPTVTIMKTASQVDFARLLDCSAWKEKILEKTMHKKNNLLTDCKILRASQPYENHLRHTLDQSTSRCFRFI